MNILEEMPVEPISYFNMLLADPRITMLQMLDMQRPLEVARVYVQLRLSEEHQQRYATPVSDEESTKTTEDDPNVWIEEERQRRERRVEMIYDPEKVISTFPRCVIMGDPGAGKTTLLRHLAIMSAQRSIAGTPSLLPVYVELQSFVRSGLHDLLDFVCATWEEAYAFPARQARVLLANYLDEGKAMLYLTLQEYFAAEYINEYQKDAELLHHRADAWWEEVLLLYIGITPDASLFLSV
jgi:predicted NACHT family NTPase